MGFGRSFCSGRAAVYIRLHVTSLQCDDAGGTRLCCGAGCAVSSSNTAVSYQYAFLTFAYVCLCCLCAPAGCMAALEAEWYLQGLEHGTGTSIDQGDEHGAVEGRGAVQHDHHGPVTGRKTPEASEPVAMAS